MVKGEKFKDCKTGKIYKVIEVKEDTILLESEKDSKQLLLNLVRSETDGTTS